MITRRGFSTLLAAMTVRPRMSWAADSPPSTHLRTRHDEVQAIRTFAEDTHPEGARARLDPAWQKLAVTLGDDADELSESEYVVRMLGLLAYFQDGHTTLFASAYPKGTWGLRLPIRVDVFYEGAYVTYAKDEGLPMLGLRIDRVAGVPVESVLRGFAEVFPASNLAGGHRWASLAFSSPGFLHGLGTIRGADDTPILVEGRLANGASVAVELTPSADGARGRQRFTRDTSELERYSETQSFGPQTTPGETGRNFVWLRSRTAYISYDRMGEDDFGKPLRVFSDEIRSALSTSTTMKVVIDLRRNGGGDNTLAEPFRHMLERSRFNRPGALVVLIAPHTFSAAQDLAARLERETFAYFIGEPPSSSPNGYGDAVPFNDGHSSLPLQVSAIRWMNSSPFDRRRWLMPDLVIPTTFSDFSSGHDAAFEAALAHSDGAPPSDDLLTAPWARQSQSQAWSPFWAVQ